MVMMAIVWMTVTSHHRRATQNSSSSSSMQQSRLLTQSLAVIRIIDQDGYQTVGRLVVVVAV